jgi:hypothetical protein
MTLLLTCLTPDYVVLAADRRLIELPSEKIVDDDAAKVVVLGTQVVFAYTGLANVLPPPRGRTDLWIVDCLTPPPPDLPAVFTKLRDDATATFRSIARVGPKSKRHAFVGAGWQQSSAGGFEPFVGVISNAQKPDGTWHEWPKPEFEIGLHRLGAGEPFGLHSSGQPADPELKAAARALLKIGAQDPARIASLLATAVRTVAGRNRAVGAGLIAVILPRAEAATGSGVSIQGFLPSPSDPTITLPPAEGAAAYYVPPDSNVGTLHAPHHVGHGGSTSDVRVYDRLLSPEEIRASYEKAMRERGITPE